MHQRALSARRGALLSATALAGAMLLAALTAMPALADGGAGGASAGGTPGGAGGIGFTGNAGQNGFVACGTAGCGGGGGGAGGGAGGTGAPNFGAGGTGGPGGTAGSPNGQNGGNGPQGGGGGGGGGYNGNGAGAATITNTSIAGGNGGNGGNGGPNDNGGGGGGAGGYGAIVTGTGASSNSSSITGGNGGDGGNGPIAASNAHGGGGGDGGVGVQFTASGATFTNTGSVTGGNGGAGGTGLAANGNPGVGGVGIVGSGLTVINSGTITGGLSGDVVTRANAITFTGGTNRLDLQAGSNIIGNVVAFSAADTLALGGTTNSTFDVSQIGAAAQYQGFGLFEKTGSSTWTLTGTTTAVTPWAINGGTLAVSQDANLGDAAGGLSFNGGTLQYLATFNSSRAITLNAGGGIFDTNSNVPALTGPISGSGGLTKIGAGALFLGGNNNYAGPTAIEAGAITATTSTALPGQTAVTVNSGAVLAIGDTVQAQIGSLADGTSGGGLAVIGFTTPSSTLHIAGNPATTFSGSFGGVGSLELDNGASLTLTGASNSNNIGTIGADVVLSNTATGGLTVSGGSLSVGGSVVVGGGTFTVANGGTVSSTDFGVGGGGGSAVVTGAGSSVTAAHGTVIGLAGPGSLTISSGAVFNSQGGAEIDTIPGLGTPTATVTGAGSTWNVGGVGLFVGNGSLGGPGILTIADGGVVNVPGNITTIGVDGTLNLGSGGLAGAIVTPALDDEGRIVANFTNTLALAADISGGGSLSKAGTGTLILTGNNSYGGGTTITGGTLQLGNGGTSGSVTGNVVDNGIFAINRSDTLTFGGVISGTGAFAQIGSGTTILSAANTYTGATNVNAGTLQTGIANALSTATAVTVASGATFNLNSFNQSIGSLAGAGNVALGAAALTTGNDNTSTTFSGAISGSGSLIKVGSGALTLAGASTYSGGTTIAGGTISLANSQALGTGSLVTTGSVVDYANGVSISNAIVLNSNTTQLQVITGTATQAGVISELNGPRPLEKVGAGTLVLTGNNTYSGPTTISAGILVVNGSIANSAVTVASGALVAGTGTIGTTTILSGGAFAPGPIGSPGSMTVAGNLAFQSGALYLVQVNPSTASSANVTTGGSAALAGTVGATFAAGSYVTRNYTIVSAAGGRSGTFDSLSTANLPAGFTASLSYTATAAILNLTATLGALNASSLSINQRNVATALNNFFNAGGALRPAFVNIFGLTGANLGNALSQLSGEPATGAQQAAFQMESQFLGLMLDPFVDGRSGIGGATGPALGFAPEREELPDDIALAYSSVLKAPAAKAPTFEQRWTAWGGAYGGGNRTSGDPAVLGSHDLSANTAGFAGGLDYHLSHDSVVGFALAGGGTNWSLSQGLGGGKSDAFQAGLYGATRWGAAYLAAAFAYTNHWMSTDRFAFAGDHLTASFNAQSFGGRVESGYRFATWYGGVTPYAAIQAQNFHTPSYAETDTNGGGFALAYNSRTATDTRSELGARFDRLIALYPGAALSLRARLAWAHDWVSDPTLAAIFQTLPGASLIVNGAIPAKDSALASAGAEYRLASGVTLLAKFDGEFANHSSTYAGTGTIRYAW